MDARSQRLRADLAAMPRGVMPRVLWPAPALPAFLNGGERVFELVVVHGEASCETLVPWAQRLALRRRCGGRRVCLEVEAVSPLECAAADERVSGYASLPGARSESFALVRVRSAESLDPIAPRRTEVYDVIGSRGVARAGAVAVLADAGKALTLAFASDLHISALWDEVESAIERSGPELLGRFMHPERLLGRFIDEANGRAARGELDLVVLGGDLVDHVFSQPRRGTTAGSRATNVRRLAAALERLEVPAIAIPGNHDHRAFPWRPQLYGLDGVGLSFAQTRRLLRATGRWSRLVPLRPSDRDALRTVEEDGAPALAAHLRDLAPATDFSLRLRGLRLVFASTGADVVSHWREVELPRADLLLRSLTSCWRNPDSEGFSDNQIGAIRASLRDAERGAALFFHAPLLHPRGGRPVEERVSHLAPGDLHGLWQRARFERRLRRAGVRRGVFFRNAGPLVETLLSTPGSLATFSGHLHQATAVLLDRSTGALRSAPIAAVAEPGRFVTLLTSPALGQLRRGAPRRPGYLLARFESGCLARLEEHSLGTH